MTDIHPTPWRAEPATDGPVAWVVLDRSGATVAAGIDSEAVADAIATLPGAPGIRHHEFCECALCWARSRT